MGRAVDRTRLIRDSHVALGRSVIKSCHNNVSEECLFNRESWDREDISMDFDFCHTGRSFWKSTVVVKFDTHTFKGRTMTLIIGA